MFAVKVVAVLALAATAIGTPRSKSAPLNHSPARSADPATLIRAASPLNDESVSNQLPLGRGMRRTAAMGAGMTNKVTCSSYPCPAGYYWYYFTDPNCPSSPDTFEAYVEYWNADESFAYDAYAGYATYWCGPVYVPGTVGSSWEYQNCTANSPWNCLDLGWTWDNHPSIATKNQRMSR